MTLGSAAQSRHCHVSRNAEISAGTEEAIATDLTTSYALATEIKNRSTTIQRQRGFEAASPSSTTFAFIVCFTKITALLAFPSAFVQPLLLRVNHLKPCFSNEAALSVEQLQCAFYLYFCKQRTNEAAEVLLLLPNQLRTSYTHFTAWLILLYCEYIASQNFKPIV